MRVRHHTNDTDLDNIRYEGAIRLSRGWGLVPTGIHVEMEPFGSTRLCVEDDPGPSPKRDLSLREDGAFVEFDMPPDKPFLAYFCGPRKTALIISNQSLSLKDLKPVFVKVRRHWWELWRTRPE